MSEETPVTQEVSIGTVDMKAFKAARAEGKETVAQPVEKPAIVEPEDPAEEVKGEEEKPKGKGGFQKRIDRLIKQTATLEEQLETTKKELAARAPTKAEEKTAPVDGEPQRESFASENEYIRALTRWEVKQEMKAEREAEEKQAIVAQQKESIASYNKRAIEASSRYDDWQEVMAQDTSLPSIVGDAIVHTIKNGPDVAYYLGKHPEVCQEMLGVHPLEAVAMAVKISEKLLKDEPEEEPVEDEETEEKELVAVEKTKSKAPAPIRPVSGGTTKSTVPLDKSDFQAYKKLRANGRVQ